MSTGSHAGRPKSWVAVSIIFIGFVIGGVGIVMGPTGSSSGSAPR